MGSTSAYYFCYDCVVILFLTYYELFLWVEALISAIVGLILWYLFDLAGLDSLAAGIFRYLSVYFWIPLLYVCGICVLTCLFVYMNLCKVIVLSDFHDSFLWLYFSGALLFWYIIDCSLWFPVYLQMPLVRFVREPKLVSTLICLALILAHWSLLEAIHAVASMKPTMWTRNYIKDEWQRCAIYCNTNWILLSLVPCACIGLSSHRACMPQILMKRYSSEMLRQPDSNLFGLYLGAYCMLYYLWWHFCSFNVSWFFVFPWVVSEYKGSYFGVFIRETHKVWIMSCFGCCGEDDMHKAADNGGPFPVKNSAGIFS